jgi:hypothetical protein
MKRALLWIGVVTVACGGKAVIDPGAGSGGTGGTQTSSSTSTSGTSTSTSSTSSSSASSGTPDCGGTACVGGYCNWGDNLCGAGGPGECDVIPDLCTEEPQPLTCGCDGQIYYGGCEAAMVGVDVSNAEICTPPLDTVPCGSTFCAYGTDYCLVFISDVGDWPDKYACMPLPPGCSGSNAACSCMTQEPCSDWCEQDPDGSVTLTCPGG